MSFRRFSLLGIAPLLPLLLIAQHAEADADDTLSLNVSTVVQQDSNLFRISSSVDPNTVLGKSTKSDQISITTVAFKLDKPYSLQRFELEVSAADYRFRTFDYLNFPSRNYAAAWHWKLTPNLYGNLTSTRNEMLNNYANYTGYNNRNLHTDEIQRFDGVFELDGAWRILGGVVESNQTNSMPFTQEGDVRSTRAEAGIRYAFRSGSSFIYTARTGRGEYLNRPQPILASLLDNRFDDHENEVRLLWALTDKTTLDARAAHRERNHAHFAARDFGGNCGNVKLNWEITGKTRLTASWARELSSYQETSTSYTSTDHFMLDTFWRIGANTALRGRYDFAQREYRGAIAPTPLNDRADILRTGMVTLEWQPLHMLSISTSLQSDRRTSNEPGFDYDAKIANVSAQLSF